MVSGEGYYISPYTKCDEVDDHSIGDIVSVEMPGAHIVIINSYETIQDILAKRPGTTSGRQIGYMALEL
jgi:hypothetical protein